MKYTIFIFLMLLSLSTFSQKSHNTASLPLEDSIHHTLTMTLNEEQMAKFYKLFSLAKVGVYETDVTGKEIKILNSFSDSLMSIWSTTYQEWYPSPKSDIQKTVVPKSDSTHKKTQ